MLVHPQVLVQPNSGSIPRYAMQHDPNQASGVPQTARHDTKPCWLCPQVLLHAQHRLNTQTCTTPLSPCMYLRLLLNNPLSPDQVSGAAQLQAIQLDPAPSATLSPRVHIRVLASTPLIGGCTQSVSATSGMPPAMPQLLTDPSAVWMLAAPVRRQAHQVLLQSQSCPEVGHSAQHP